MFGGEKLKQKTICTQKVKKNIIKKRDEKK